MKLQRIDLVPSPASTFETPHDWRVFALAEVDAELKAMERALGGAVKQRPAQIDISEEEWARCMEGFTARLDRGDGIDSAMAGLEASEFRLALGSRIAQARRALKYAARLHASGADPTSTVLLPARYAQRVERLLGFGDLPVAWLYCVDVLKF